MKQFVLVLFLMVAGAAVAQSNGGYVDLGLPSGTQWKTSNQSEYLTFDETVEKYGNQFPTKAQFEELLTLCEEVWVGNGIG
ncbi:MAG: hypothetical protein IJQ97_02985 [Paludibacteraceae bacterium]|nr:hypothetical protein [Paludibacteraceae bacterium]